VWCKAWSRACCVLCEHPLNLLLQHHTLSRPLLLTST
jgi:hypothetical protein